MAQGQYTFSHFINLQLQISIEFFEFYMEFKEILPFDIPVKPAGIDIQYLEIGEQYIQLFSQHFCLCGIKADLIGSHNSRFESQIYLFSQAYRLTSLIY